MSHPMLNRKPLNAWLKDLLGVAAGLGAAAPLAALANPTGGHVVAGSASISNPSANGTVVHQNTQGAVINWQQFSVGSGQYVQFVQPSSSAVVLNRVTGGNASLILGNITANGQVFLVNPFGILFGKSAVVDAQGFVASTLDLSNNDFMRGHYAFVKGSGAPDASVVNQGSLTGTRGGYVVLMGDYVENDGVINTENGRVVLAAGGGALLTLGDDDLISYKVDKATLARLAGVDNAGRITADGGGVIMTADVANALTATAVNNSGFVAAHSIKSENGVIVLSARGGGIEDTGTLDASATQTGVKGGDIIIRGDGRTEIAPSALIQTQGDHAKGGFIELSGHTLTVRGLVAAGRGGNLLIDPFRIHIVTGNGAPVQSASTVNVGVGYITGKLNSGTAVTLVASNSIGHTGSVTALTATTGNGNLSIKMGSLSVGAGGSLANASSCVNLGVCKPGTGVTFTSGPGNINLTGLNITINGKFLADAGVGPLSNVNLGNVSALAITMNGDVIHVGNLTATGAANSTGIFLTASDPARFTQILTGNLITTGGGDVNLRAIGSGGVSIGIGGSVNAKGAFLASAQALAGSGGNVSITGNAVARSIVLNAAGVNGGGSVSVHGLHANGLAANDNVSITANDAGSAAFSGGIIHVLGPIKVDHGGAHLAGKGGGDSGGNVTVNGGISAAGSVSVLASNFGTCCGGSVHILANGVKGQFINIATRATNTANHSGARINITGNLTATGTATAISPSVGVNLFAGSSGARNGAPSITVNGNIKASNGAVNLLVNGNNGGRSIAVHSTGSGWGFIKAQRVRIDVLGSGAGGKIDVGTITTLGSSFHGNASLQAGGNGGSGHVIVHGAITISGTSLSISDHGNGTGRSVSVTGNILMTGTFGAVGLNASNAASYGGAAVTARNITAPGQVSVFVDGHGKGGAQLSIGNVTASRISIDAVNGGGGSAALSAGNLTAARQDIRAFAVAGSSQAAHISLGAINAVSLNGKADVSISAAGKANTVSMGVVNVSGHSAPSSCECGGKINPVGAVFQVLTHGGASDTIAINGNIKVTGLAGSTNAFGDAVVEIAAFAGSGSKALPAKVSAAISGGITVDAAEDAHLLIRGSASGALAVKAGRDIDAARPSNSTGVLPSLILDASAVTLQAGRNISLSGASLGVGSGAAPGVAGDHVVTHLFGLGSIAPNAAFIAGGNIDLGTLAGGGVGYLLIETGGNLTFGTLTLGSGAVVQLTTPNATDTLGVGNGAGTTVYSAADITQFAGDNVVIGGSALTGAMTVGTANLGSMAVTLMDNGSIKSSGLLTAGSLTLVAGVGAVDVTTHVASVTVVSGASVLVDDTAFTGSATLAVANANANSIGNLSFEFGGDGALATNVHIAGGLTLLADGNLDLSGRTIVAPLQVQLVAGGVAPGPLAVKNITLTGVDITTQVFAATAGGSILDAGTAGTITAGGLFMSAVQGNIDMHNTQLNIGSGSVGGVIGDASAAAVLALAGLLGGNFKPNGTFVAGGGSITLGGLDFTGNYLYLQADSINILGTVVTHPGAVIQLTPFTPTNSIGIENTAPNGDDSNFLNQNLLGLFAGDTILIGRTGESGAVDLGTNGAFTLAPGTNLIIDTSGVVTGLGTVTSTGLVTTLDALFSSISFQPPTAGEIDPTSGSNSDAQQKKQELIEFIEGGGQGGGTITQDTGTASVCH